jgi:hypothetical protein
MDRRLPGARADSGTTSRSPNSSTRFKDLREDRERHVHEQLLARSSDASHRALAQLDPAQRITAFEFIGVGHLTTVDAYLAAQAAARAREHRELAQEALAGHHNRTHPHHREAPQDESLPNAAHPERGTR